METQNFILEGCKREVALSYTRAELQPYFDKAYLAAQPSLQLPGFRKGKVPVAMIKQRFGKELENDALENIANEGFQEFVASENVSPVGRPTLRDIQRESDGSAKFTIGYEVLPEFDLGNYRGLAIRKPVHATSSEDVENEIDGLLVRYGTKAPAETVADEMHIAKVQFRELDEATGTPLLSGKPEEFDVFLKREPADSELKAKLLNTKVGDSFRQSMPTSEDGSQQIQMLASVTEITQIIPAEFTNEFVETVTEGKFVTTEELREEYERQIAEFWEGTANRVVDDQIVKQLLEMHDFAPPQSVVQEVISNMLREQVEKLPEKKLPKNFDIQTYVQRVTPVATNTAKWMIVRDRIIEAESLEVTDEDVNARVEELASSLGTAENFEYLRSLVAGNPELQHQIMQDKVMETLRGYAVLSEVPDTEFAKASE